MVNREDNSYKVVVIILCHNSRKWLERCLETIMKTSYKNFHVVLVDNATADGSVKEIDGKYEKLTIIYNTENVGWCKGNNIGIKYALTMTPDYIYLSNADVLFFDENWLSELIKFKFLHDEYMIIGPLQYKYGDDTQINEWSKYILENGNRNVHYMWSDHISSVNKKYKYNLENSGNDVWDVYFIQGSAMLIDTRLITKIGVFDELYFLYYDELDFCRRCKRIGGKIALVPTSKIMHYESGDTSATSKMQNERELLYMRNKYLFILSDYNLCKGAKREILCKWIINDVKHCFQGKSATKAMGQVFNILWDIIKKSHSLLSKKKKEKKMEKNIIMEKIVQCIDNVVPDFTIDGFNCDLKEDFGLDSIGVMELVIYIEEMFEVEFDEEVELHNLYNPAFILKYIMERDV